MQASSAEALPVTRPNLAGDLMRFALASIATGLATAITAGAVVLLLA